MVLHYLSERPEQSVRDSSAAPAGIAPITVPGPVSSSARRSGNSVVRHRVTRRLRAVVRAELHRLPATADLVVRARPEAADADSAVLRRDLAAGLDRLLPSSAGAP